MKKIIIAATFVLVVLGIYFLVQGIKREEVQYSNTKLPEIIINSLKSNSVIQSPLMIRGRAKGMWFFEASFPIILVDENGKEIVTTPAHAEAEWMTEGYVPFSAELVFSRQKSGTHGTLIFKRDNPSGLPENNASVSIPITF